MKAAVLSIGTELTRGELVNTNATWLAERLTLMGYEVGELTTIEDDVPEIVATLKRLAAKSQVLVSTGGLGPTSDDKTADAVSAALSEPLVRHEPSLEAIRGRMIAAGREMSASNAKQADLPASAEVLPNGVGTAPAFAVTIGEARAFFLPGVPREMQHIFGEHIEPRLASGVARLSHPIRIRTFGMPESQVGDRLASIEAREPNISIGYRASFPEVEIRVLAKGNDPVEAELLAARVAEEVRRELGTVVYGDGEETLPVYLGRVLRDRGLTLAIAESCTGGMIGELVTAAPGSSEYLLLDAVTYSNAAKTDLLGVSGDVLRAYGAVSEEVSVAMAEGALRLADADLAVAVTGIAGPGGGTEAKPVGTVWVALARKGKETEAELCRFPGDRDRIRKRASYVALKKVLDAALRNGR